MLRNKEIRWLLALFALLTLASTLAGLAICPAAGCLALVSAGLFGALFGAFTKARYDRLARLSEQIDRVLHNADLLAISEAEEGELAILQSEIYKMTLRLREQKDALQREKNHLADALADIAHQLRTPLTSAHLLLSLLKNNPQDRERKALLREAEELFVQMDWLLTALLKLSRLDAGIVVFQREPVAVRELIQAALRPFALAFELHNIAVHTELPEAAVLQGDQGWLSEALQNIFKNCLEQMGDGGTLSITCSDTLLFTEITIQDSGPGFQEQDLPFLFDRFYRGQTSATGYGIGLALCKTIVTGQGGTITAKNHRQGGAVFAIRFPK